MPRSRPQAGSSRSEHRVAESLGDGTSVPPRTSDVMTRATGPGAHGLCLVAPDEGIFLGPAGRPRSYFESVRLLAVVLTALAFAVTPPSWRTFQAEGISVRYPPSWFATARPLTPVTSPGQALAVASYPLPRSNARANGCEPKEALDRMSPAGAFVFGWEYGDLSARAGIRPRDFPPRPEHFKLRGFAPYECLGPSYMLRFSDAGRAFQVHRGQGRGPKPRTGRPRSCPSSRRAGTEAVIQQVVRGAYSGAAEVEAGRTARRPVGSASAPRRRMPRHGGRSRGPIR